MKDIRLVAPDTYWIGASDRRLAKFENLFPIPRGVSYNAYVILDEKTVLLDTVDQAVSRTFFDKLEACLAGRGMDYVVINHMEPDHCAALQDLVHRWPQVTLVCNSKTLQMIKQFFTFELEGRTQLIGEGDTLCTGKHTLHFAMAPMVHWPEAMVSYDSLTKVLFSADAFGTFGALNGNLFADEMDFPRDWLDDARRYYANIVGKYGPQVQALLTKAAALDIQVICPLHGPIWRENIGWFIQKYDLWSRYEPEDQGVVIIYGSMYGDTQEAAGILAGMLAEGNVKNIAMYDVSVTDVSYLISEIFRYSHLVLASPTYNMGLYPRMENLLSDMKALAVQNRTVALMENGTWAPMAAKHMRTALDTMKNITILEPSVTIKSALKDEQEPELLAMADAIISSLN